MSLQLHSFWGLGRGWSKNPKIFRIEAPVPWLAAPAGNEEIDEAPSNFWGDFSILVGTRRSRGGWPENVQKCSNCTVQTTQGSLQFFIQILEKCQSPEPTGIAWDGLASKGLGGVLRPLFVWFYESGLCTPPVPPCVFALSGLLKPRC